MATGGSILSFPERGPWGNPRGLSGQLLQLRYVNFGAGAEEENQSGLHHSYVGARLAEGN
jgi:hypothetical protein